MIATYAAQDLLGFSCITVETDTAGSRLMMSAAARWDSNSAWYSTQHEYRFDSPMQSVGFARPLQQDNTAFVSCNRVISGCAVLCSVSKTAKYHVSICDGTGYGFYRPQMTLFDPGWRGEQTKGSEDWGTADFGNDPMGIIDR